MVKLVSQLFPWIQVDFGMPHADYLNIPLTHLDLEDLTHLPLS